jgi:hypothetical protein
MADATDGADGMLALVLTLIILVPVRPSRENVISMPSVRRNVCARRSRPASAREFLAYAPPVEMSLRANAESCRTRIHSSFLAAHGSNLVVKKHCRVWLQLQ